MILGLQLQYYIKQLDWISTYTKLISEFYTTEKKLTGKAPLIVKRTSTAGHPVARGGPDNGNIDGNVLSRHSNFIY